MPSRSPFIGFVRMERTLNNRHSTRPRADTSVGRDPSRPQQSSGDFRLAGETNQFHPLKTEFMNMDRLACSSRLAKIRLFRLYDWAQKSLRFPGDWSLLEANCAAPWSSVLRIVRPASSRGSKMRFWNVLFLGLSLGFVFSGSALAQPKSTGSVAPATAAAPDGGKQASPSVAGATDVAAPSKSDADGKNKSAPGTKGDAAGATSAPAAPSMSSSGPSRSVSSDAAAGVVDGATYLVRLRDLEQRVDELKEQIRRSHTRLSLLSDTILAGGVGGARAEITFINDMSNVFQLTRALFLLDGAVQNNKQDETGALAEQKEIPVFSGSIPPGDHTLQVLVQLRGHGFGVFSYLQGYRFEIRSSHSFTVTEGKTIEVRAIAYEKGGVTVPLEQRPAMRYFERVRTSVQGDKGPMTAPGKTDKAASGNVSVGVGSE